MISAVVRVERGVEALAVTLGALVPAVAEGLVGDAVVLLRAPDPAVERVADAVGATLVVDKDGAWPRGAAAARREWILCLADGDVPSEGWIRTLERFVASSPPECRFGRLGRRRGFGGAVRALLSGFGGPRVRAGDLVHRSLFAAGRVHRPARVAATIERDPVFG
jgi:hypothetical protein